MAQLRTGSTIGGEGVMVYKNGSNTFTGTSMQVTNSFIDSDTLIFLVPTGTAAGTWSVSSSSGFFTVTSTSSESGVSFDWSAFKAG